MRLTEEQAKTKWCPKVGARGGDGRPTSQSKCLGSGCVWWRWTAEAPAPEVDDAEGFCGVAGAPFEVTGEPT